MTQTELNQLPEDQQRNALLAIALGFRIDYTKRSSGSSEWAFGVHTTYMAASIWLHKWRPAGDGQLMWELVRELRKPIDSILGFYSFFAATENGQALIAAYIAADPKGLIKKWRKENE